jgi:4-diphosphocytidyl-2-C-methyl-D-erythritol kinase
MPLTRYLDDVVAWAPAKVNLFLEVLGKRPDGYHEIATLMVAVSLYDTLVFREDMTGTLNFECNHPQLDAGPDNLVLRAANLLRERTRCSKGCSVRLVKRIPLAAGLAGGSSDAAATLLGLNRLWQLGLSREELAGLGAELGSDVPFFFYTPAAWCTGRGELVERLPLQGNLNLVLLCPRFGISTADVYRRVRVPETPCASEPILAAVAAGATAEQLAPHLFNRLEAIAETIDPRLAVYRRLLRDQQPAGELMSGSGSALFALASAPAEAARISAALKATVTEASVFQVRSCA